MLHRVGEAERGRRPWLRRLVVGASVAALPRVRRLWWRRHPHAGGGRAARHAGPGHDQPCREHRTAGDRALELPVIPLICEKGLTMTFSEPNPAVRPTGAEVEEFLDPSPIADEDDHGDPEARPTGSPPLEPSDGPETSHGAA